MYIMIKVGATAYLYYYCMYMLTLMGFHRLEVSFWNVYALFVSLEVLPEYKN